MAIALRTSRLTIRDFVSEDWTQAHKYVGGIGIRIQNEFHRHADIGYVLRRDFWNKGIVTEATREIC